MLCDTVVNDGSSPVDRDCEGYGCQFIYSTSPVDRLTLSRCSRRVRTARAACFIAWFHIWLQIVDSHAYCTPVDLQTLRPSHCGVACHALSCHRLLIAFLRCVWSRRLHSAIAPSRIPIDRCIIVCSIVDIAISFQCVLLVRLPDTA